jgi:hypothetical protein
MRNMMLAAVLALGLPLVAHAEGTACDQKMAGSTSYGDEAAKAGTTVAGSATPTKPDQKVTGSTSYGDEASKIGNGDKTANAQMAANSGARDCTMK